MAGQQSNSKVITAGRLRDPERVKEKENELQSPAISLQGCNLLVRERGGGGGGLVLCVKLVFGANPDPIIKKERGPVSSSSSYDKRNK